RLGRELASGTFGENVTTSGLEVAGSLIGEVWRLGSAGVQVTSPRIPCAVFAGWMDEPQGGKRVARAGRAGAYLRGLEEGLVGAGDPAEVLARPATRVTIAESVRAYYGDVDLMRRLLLVEGRSSKWDEIALSVLGRAGPDAGAAAGAGRSGARAPAAPGDSAGALTCLARSRRGRPFPPSAHSPHGRRVARDGRRSRSTSACPSS